MLNNILTNVFNNYILTKIYILFNNIFNNNYILKNNNNQFLYLVFR